MDRSPVPLPEVGFTIILYRIISPLCTPGTRMVSPGSWHGDLGFRSGYRDHLVALSDGIYHVHAVYNFTKDCVFVVQMGLR